MSRYYVQMYTEYPIYEPAEGGYYYAGKCAEDMTENEFDGFETALGKAINWIWMLNENAPDDEKWVILNTSFYEEKGRCLIAYKPSKLIGDGAQIYIESEDAYKKGERGWKPYE